MLTVERLDGADGGGLDDVARRAAAAYGFGAGAQLALYPLTENATYRVSEPGRDAVVLRVYRPHGRPEVEIQSELAWMRALRDDLGPLVPTIVATGSGAHLVEVAGAGALPACLCVAFSLAPGREPADGDLRAWFPRLGEITARFHRQARAWQAPTWFSRPTWDVATTLGASPHWGPWQASVPDPAQQAILGRAADRVVERLRAFGTGRARFGLVHADLRLANILVEGDAITVLDFDDCGLAWYLYDLACALTFNEARTDVDELVGGWVEAYRAVEPLSAADEAEIPTFLLLRRLMITAYVGLRSDTELAAELARDGYNDVSCALAERYLGRLG